MSDDPRLEEVVKELSNSIDIATPTRRKGPHAQTKLKYLFTTRFGEVLQCFIKYGRVKDVARETGISTFNLRRYFLQDDEFLKLLRGANHEIFLSATKELRDQQENMALKGAALAEEALDKMEELLHESDNEHIQFKVAQDLLDRDPRLSRTKRLEGSGSPVRVDVKILQLAAATAREIENYDKEDRSVDEIPTERSSRPNDSLSGSD